MTTDCCLHARIHGPLKEDHRWLHRDERSQLQEQRAQEEVGEIGAPGAAKCGLLGPMREEPFERDEDGRVEHQIQEEPVQAEERSAAAHAIDRHFGAAEERRGQRERNARDTERLVLPERKADRAEQERADEHEV